MKIDTQRYFCGSLIFKYNKYLLHERKKYYHHYDVWVYQYH